MIEPDFTLSRIYRDHVHTFFRLDTMQRNRRDHVNTRVATKHQCVSEVGYETDNDNLVGFESYKAHKSYGQHFLSRELESTGIGFGVLFPTDHQLNRQVGQNIPPASMRTGLED